MRTVVGGPVGTAAQQAAGAGSSLKIALSAAFVDTRTLWIDYDEQGSQFKDASRPLWSNAKYFSGVGSADDLVAPELRHFVSRKAKEEADIESSRGRARTLGGGGVHDALAHGGLPFKGDGTSATPKAKGAKGIAKGGQGRGSGEAAPGSQ